MKLMVTGAAILATGLGLGGMIGAVGGFVFAAMIFTMDDEKDVKKES